MTQKIEISSRTILFTVFLLLFLKVLWISRELIYALFLAFIFMSALKPAVNRLEEYRLPRSIAAFLVFITTIVLLIFLGAVVLPPLVAESLAFFKNLPVLIVNAFPFSTGMINTDSLVQFLPNITENFFKLATSLFSNLIFVISVLFFTLYFLMEEKFLKNFLDRFIDSKQADIIMNAVYKAEQRMGAWVWGEVILMTVIGVMTYIGLTILGVRYVLPLAVLAGLLEIVPIIGPIISLIPAFFVSVASSWVSGLSVTALYLVIQQLENNLVVPLVMKKTVGLHPIITLIALTIGGKLGGLMGILLAVPVALVAETIFIEFSSIKK